MIFQQKGCIERAVTDPSAPAERMNLGDDTTACRAVPVGRLRFGNVRLQRPRPVGMPEFRGAQQRRGPVPAGRLTELMPKRNHPFQRNE